MRFEPFLRHLAAGSAVLLLAGPLLAGCQTADRPDPNSTVTAQGNFLDLANCYAQSQQSVASRTGPGSNGARAASVTIFAPVPSAAGTLSSGRSKSTDEAILGGAGSYRVDFVELANNRTQISGTSIGALTRPFVWFEAVLPVLRTCANDPDLR